jgi:hypothetical protein
MFTCPNRKNMQIILFIQTKNLLYHIFDFMHNLSVKYLIKSLLFKQQYYLINQQLLNNIIILNHYTKFF